MKIHGLQKMTLLDYPGRVACTVFLGGCDFRCPFCHNADILDMNAPALIEEEEFFRFLGTRKGLLDGVAITGGEPLLRKDIPEFLKKIKDMGYKIKLDTNGNHPELLKKIVEEGLVDYVAMDIKNSKERYGETIGIPGFDISKVDESVRYLIAAGASDVTGGSFEYEFRTTVLEQFHNMECFEKISQWIAGAEKYYLQAFVDRDTVPFSGLSAYKEENMKRFAAVVGKTVKSAEIRGVS